jgi:hypothetical protein
MRKPQVIADEVYHAELDRLRVLAKFPEVPNAQREMIRALRRITETDMKFLHNLITGFVDTADTCPMPSDLYAEANRRRTGYQKPLGNPACLKCNGTGWVYFTKHVDPLHDGIGYEADYSARCTCAPAIPRNTPHE